MKYRGQVVPTNKRVEAEVEVLDITRTPSVAHDHADGRVDVTFQGALWVDGKRIYRVLKFVVGVSSREPEPAPRDRGSDEVILDPAREPWMLDHAPTWTVPALPLTSMLDRIGSAAVDALGAPLSSLEDVQVHRWLTLAGPTRTRTEVRPISSTEAEVTLLAFRDAATPALSRFEKVASARARVGAPAPRPSPLAPLAHATAQPDPYLRDELFQGPAFHRMRGLHLAREGASSRLDATPTSIPVGLLHPGMLDASLHGIPADASLFSAEIAPDLAPIPYRVKKLAVFGPAPTSGELRCEVRFEGVSDEGRFADFRIQLIASQGHAEAVWLEWTMTMILLPKGSIGMAPGPDRRAFLRDKRFVPGVRLSSVEGGVSVLTRKDVQAIAWLPGTVDAVYGSTDTADIAVREHLGHRLGVHPSTVRWNGHVASTLHEPLGRYPLRVEREGDIVRVTDAGDPHLDLDEVSVWWRKRLGPGTRAIEDLFYALVRRFTGRVFLQDPAAFEQLKGRPVLYLANHQTMVESLMFVVLSSPLADVPSLGLAKIEHRDSWIGRLSRAVAAWPGASDPQLLEFFDRSNKEALPGILQRIAMRMATEKQSLLVHVEGTRSLKAAEPVVKLSSVIVDMAIHARAPIVPVRFHGGLPRELSSTRFDFPIGFGRQDYWLGAPLLPEELEAMPYGERRARVVAAINAAGPPVVDEVPNPGDAQLAAEVQAWSERTGAETALAAILVALTRAESLEPAWRQVVEAMQTGDLSLADSPEGQAVAGVARELFGPRGPRIHVG